MDEVEKSVLNGSVESIPYAVKKRLVLSRAFYLPKEVFNELLQDVEHDVPKGQGMSDMAYVVRTIDTYGDWLAA